MATEAVYQFMKSQNKPCNVNDIVSNLSNRNKSSIQQSLEKLKDQRKIFEKVYGKQKIYCIVQEINHEAAELARINNELQVHADDLEVKRKDLENEIKKKEGELEALKSAPTLEEAVRERDAVRVRVHALEVKLDQLMERSGSQLDSGENKKKVEKLREQYSREYSRRKRMCTEIIDGIMEGFPGTKKQLYDSIGIEERIIK